MRELILKALKTKFVGVDAKTLERIADKLCKTVTTEDAVQTAVDGVTVTQLMESYGDARANAAQRTAIENYEKQYGLKDGKSIKATNPPMHEPAKTEPTKSQESEEMKAMREMMEKLQKRLDEQDRRNVTSSRKAKLTELLKDAPEAVKTIYEGTFGAMTFNDDAAFNTWLEATKPTIENLTNTLKAKGGVTTPPTGAGGAGNNAASEIIKARAEKAAKMQPSAIVGVATAEK